MQHKQNGTDLLQVVNFTSLLGLLLLVNKLTNKQLNSFTLRQRKTYLVQDLPFICIGRREVVNSFVIHLITIKSNLQRY